MNEPVVFMEQRLARSRCFRFVFVFEHFFYSSATHILAGHKGTVNSSHANFLTIFFSLCITRKPGRV